MIFMAIRWIRRWLRLPCRPAWTPSRYAKETPRVNEIPFSSERKMMTTIHTKDGKNFALTKGAPGPVLAHCTCCQEGSQEYSLADSHCQAIRQRVTELQGQGFYVLGVANRELPIGVSANQAESEMTFLGLLALIDPPRPGAAEAIARAQAAGIRVVMITGDNGLTAQAIAATLGIGVRVVDAAKWEPPPARRWSRK